MKDAVGILRFSTTPVLDKLLFYFILKDQTEVVGGYIKTELQR